MIPHWLSDVLYGLICFACGLILGGIAGITAAFNVVFGKGWGKK